MQQDQAMLLTLLCNSNLKSAISLSLSPAQNNDVSLTSTFSLGDELSCYIGRILKLLNNTVGKILASMSII